MAREQLRGRTVTLKLKSATTFEVRAPSCLRLSMSRFAYCSAAEGPIAVSLVPSFRRPPLCACRACFLLMPGSASWQKPRKRKCVQVHTRAVTLPNYVSSAEDLCKAAVRLMRPELPLTLRLMGIRRACTALSIRLLDARFLDMRWQLYRSCGTFDRGFEASLQPAAVPPRHLHNTPA